jgi:hypothetical protein
VRSSTGAHVSAAAAATSGLGDDGVAPDGVGADGVAPDGVGAADVPPTGATSALDEIDGLGGCSDPPAVQPQAPTSTPPSSASAAAGRLAE